jgi:hypothetical protein
LKIKNPFITALKNNEIHSIDEWNSLFEKDNVANKNNYTPLLFILENNKTYNLLVSNQQLDFFIKNSNLNAQSDFGNFGYTALMMIFKYNINQELNLSSQSIDFLIKNTNLNLVNKNNETALLLLIGYDDPQIKISEEHFNYLFDNSSLKIIDCYGKDAISYFMANYQLSQEQWQRLINESDFNKNKKIIFEALQYSPNLTQKQWQEIILKTDHQEKISNGQTPINFAITHNRRFKNKTWEIFLNKSNLKILNNDHDSVLHLIIKHRVPLTEKLWLILLEKSDTNIKNQEGITPLMSAFLYQAQLTPKVWKSFFEKSDINLKSITNMNVLDFAILHYHENNNVPKELWSALIKETKNKNNLINHSSSFEKLPKDLLETLIENSSLTETGIFNKTILSIIIENHKKIKLSQTHWSLLYDSTKKLPIKANQKIANTLAKAIIKDNFNELSHQQTFQLLKDFYDPTTEETPQEKIAIQDYIKKISMIIESFDRINKITTMIEKKSNNKIKIENFYTF